jgi:hypothetical protein
MTAHWNVFSKAPWSSTAEMAIAMMFQDEIWRAPILIGMMGTARRLVAVGPVVAAVLQQKRPRVEPMTAVSRMAL